MTETDRQFAIIDAIEVPGDHPDYDRYDIAKKAYESLLAYFDEQEPAVAAAIRFGLEKTRPVSITEYGAVADGTTDCTDAFNMASAKVRSPSYWINYPEPGES